MADEQPGTSAPRGEQPNNEYSPMEEGEVESDTDQDPSVLEVPAKNWAKNVGVKSVQNIKMGHAPRVNAEEPNDWGLGNAVRETEKTFSTDLLLLMTETINDPLLLTKHWFVTNGKGSLSPKIHEQLWSPYYARTIPPSTRCIWRQNNSGGQRSPKHYRKKCDGCIPCKLCGKSVEPNLVRKKVKYRN